MSKDSRYARNTERDYNKKPLLTLLSGLIRSETKTGGALLAPCSHSLLAFMLFVYFCYIRTPFKLAMLNWMLQYKYLNK